MFFCTLFNFHYLAKGILTIQSLLNVSPDSIIYVLVMDQQTEHILNNLGYPQLKTITLSHIETPELLEAKRTRTEAEYCWTCGSVFCYYCITSFSLPHCVYIDADLFFYASPSLLLENSNDCDVMITLHRYTKGYDQSETSGKYCVQFVYFKNSANGLSILCWWKNACLKWCYNRVEDGKFGDQKYLDDWPEKFKGVYVMEHEGGGVAPWNIQQYRVTSDKGLTIYNNSTGKSFPLVFYHFHHLNNFKLRGCNEFRLGPYTISPEVVALIYKPYIRELISIYDSYASEDLDPLGSKEIEVSFIRYFVHRMKVAIRPKDKIIWRA